MGLILGLSLSKCLARDPIRITMLCRTASKLAVSGALLKQFSNTGKRMLTFSYKIHAQITGNQSNSLWNGWNIWSFIHFLLNKILIYVYILSSLIWTFKLNQHNIVEGIKDKNLIQNKLNIDQFRTAKELKYGTQQILCMFMITTVDYLFFLF